MDETSESSTKRLLLNSTNYNKWIGIISARLRVKGVLQYATTNITAPSDPSLSIEAEIFNGKQGIAAGEIFLSLNGANQELVADIDGDPYAMFALLKKTYQTGKASSRFNALSAMLAIRKTDDETLYSVVNRVNAAMTYFKSLRPTTYDIKALDNDIAIMAMLNALPSEEYSSFVSSLILITTADKSIIEDAFRSEDIHRARISAEVAETAMRAGPLECYLCRGPHGVRDCPKLSDAQAAVSKPSGGGRKNSNRHKDKAAAASSTPTTPETPTVEKAGRTAILEPRRT